MENTEQLVKRHSNTSDSIAKLAEALSKAQGSLEHAKKDTENPFFKSVYADLASCIDAAKKPLADNGLSVVQTTELTDNGLILKTVLMHSSGEWITSIYPINPVKSDPQGYGSAMTYARRYSFCAITGVASDDDDGNAASQPGKKQPPSDDIVIRALLKSVPTMSKEQLLAIDTSTLTEDQKRQLRPVYVKRKKELEAVKELTDKERIQQCKTQDELNAVLQEFNSDQLDACEDVILQVQSGFEYNPLGD